MPTLLVGADPNVCPGRTQGSASTEERIRGNLIPSIPRFLLANFVSSCYKNRFRFIEHTRRLSIQDASPTKKKELPSISWRIFYDSFGQTTTG